MSKKSLFYFVSSLQIIYAIPHIVKGIKKEYYVYRFAICCAVIV
ncbi:hypothetical protein MHA_1581 [Mannheimia haemolytica PHL213]|nr:hypothetical protein MHA_1581 [Mannheimia haemolytica PHL213]